MQKIKKVKASTRTLAPMKLKMPAPEAGKKVVLNIVNANVKLPPAYDKQQWQEVIASKEVPNAHLPIDITGLGALPDASVDAIYNAGSLSYLYAHEVIPVLQNFYRILRYAGTAVFSVSDVQAIGQAIGQGKLEKELYRAPAGSITGIDLLYGHRASIMRGRTDLQIKTGFTAHSIIHKLTPLGFGEMEVKRDGWMLHVVARKIDASPKDMPLVRIREEDLNEVMRKRDNIVKDPEFMKITPEDAFQP